MIELAVMAIVPECWGVAPTDPGAVVTSGALDIELGDSIIVFTPPTEDVLLPATSPEHPAEF